MKTNAPRLLLLLPWLSLPLMAAVYLLWWDRIPERLAVHFGPDGTPNNWMTRGQSLAFDLAVLLFVLVMSNLKFRRQNQTERHSGLFILNGVVLFVTLLFVGLLKYNITGSLF
jgi:uncharacterized membrane protein